MTTELRHNWLRSGSYNLILNIQSLVFGFGGFYLLIRMIDKESFGIWTLFVATTTIFDMARSGLVQNALIKSLSANPKEKHADIISASVFLSGILMLGCIIINISMASCLAHLWHYPGLVPMFYTYSLVYLVQGALAQFQWIEQANLSFSGVLFSGIVKQGGPFFYILTCFVFHIELSLISLIWSQFISTVLATGIEYFFVKRFLLFSRKVDRKWVKEMFHYGKYVFGTSISVVLIGTVNQMMLGTIISPGAAGSFSVITRITNLIDLPTNALSVVVFPQSARRFSTEGSGSSKYLYEKSVGAILALLIPALLFLVLFPTWVITIIAGSKYLETVPMIQITALYCLFTPFNRMFGIILDSIGKPKVNFFIILLFTSLEATLTYFFVKQHGIMGAVYAPLAATLFFSIVIQVILHREFRANFLNPFVYAVKFYPELFNNYAKPFIHKLTASYRKQSHP